MNIPAEVISRAQAGDKAASDELISLALPLIRGVANTFAKPFLPADDLQSEGVITLMETLGDFDPAKGSFKHFLYGRLRRCFAAILQREKRFHGRWVDQEVNGIREQESDSPAVNGEDGAIDPAIAETLLSELPETRRALLEHYYGIGSHPLTSDQLAALLGTRPSTVRMRVRAAMETLKAVVREKKIGIEADEIEAN